MAIILSFPAASQCAAARGKRFYLPITSARMKKLNAFFLLTQHLMHVCYSIGNYETINIKWHIILTYSMNGPSVFGINGQGH